MYYAIVSCSIVYIFNPERERFSMSMRGTAREARQSRRPMVPAAVLIAEAEQEMVEEEQEWDSLYLFEEDWYDDDGGDLYPVFADEHFDDCGDDYGDDSWLMDDLDDGWGDEGLGQFDEPMDYGPEWGYEPTFSPESESALFFDRVDPEEIRRQRLEQEANEFMEMIKAIVSLAQLLVDLERTVWISTGLIDFEVREHTGQYTGWYRVSGGLLESNILTGEFRYRQ